MKAINGENGVSRWLGLVMTRALLVAGFLFGALSGLAQISPPTQPTNSPLASWSFQDPTNWTSDQGFAPISFTNIALSYMGDGASLVVDTNVPTWLQYCVYEPTNAATNLTVDSGSVTFWFAPDWASTNQGGAGPGDRGTLFEAGSFTPDSSYGWWSIYVDDGGNNIYFSTQTNDLSSNFWTWVSAPISWTTNYFHFVVLTYSPTNTSLYLDGVLATNGPPLTVYPGLNALTNGFWIGSSSNGVNQSHGMFDWVATFNYPLDSNDIATMFNWYFPNYIIDPYNADYMTVTNGEYPFFYGTNLSLYATPVTNNLASLFVVNSDPDVLYEIQGTTNLAHPDWFSEGFVDGSELTNLTMASVTFLGGGSSSLFLRVRSWIDTTGTGIPDWWWLEFFGQTTNVNAYASAANDGFDNLYKFQNGLNPTNYYNPNPVPDFFGCLDATGTNVILEWSNAPGPVIGYALARGNFNSGNNNLTSLGTVSSNANFFEDVGANTNDNAQNDDYTITALYPGGGATPTNIWYWSDGSPAPGSIYAYADATGTNVLLSWTPPGGIATNYTIERGVYNTTNYSYVFFPIGQAASNATSYEVTGILTNADNWSDEYGVVAVFPGGGLSTPVTSSVGNSPINVGSANGPAAPTNFYGYADSTGTNLFLNWGPVSGSVTNYLLYGGNYSFGSGYNVYTPLGKAGAGTNSFEEVGGVSGGSTLYSTYAVVAVYTNASLSQAALWNAYLGAPAPGTFVAYVDWTGTNIMLAWSGVSSATGYVIQKSGDYGSTYSSLAQITPNTTVSYEDVNGVSGGSAGVPSISYQLQATYPHGGVSPAVTANVVTTPPPPGNLSVSVNGADAVLTWTPVLTPGITYTIERGVYHASTGTYSYSQIGQTTGTTYTDTGAITGNNGYNNIYEIIANYPGGQSSTPDNVEVNQTAAPPAGTSTADLSVAAQLVRNQTGHWELVFSDIPPGVQTIVLDWYYWNNYDADGSYQDFSFGYPFTVGTDIPVSGITNGIYVIPDFMTTNAMGDIYDGKAAMIQAIGTNGEQGQISQAGLLPYDAPCFVDGREHLWQNMLFQLRAATISQPNPLIGLSADSNYVESSIFYLAGQPTFFGTSPYIAMDDLWPFTVNYQLHQYLYDTNYSGPASFVWQTNLVTVPAPAVLGIGDPYWISQDGNNLADIGITAATNPTNSVLTQQNGVYNLFNLEFETARLQSAADDVTGFLLPGAPWLLPPGTPVTIDNNGAFDLGIFSQTADPSLALSGYYFAPVNTYGTALPYGNTPSQPYPLPCLTGFANTNQTGVLIASVGTPTVIGGWGRFSLQNSSKFAYLGQYFEPDAFVMTNGNITTNMTGVVSPYGDFFPTQPGDVAMITMPDYNNDAQGTGVVHVIALETDANHDGTMDSSYFGPDFTSTNRPFRFWIDDSTDSGDYGGNGIPGQGAQGDAVMETGNDDYRGFPYYAVRGTRDLVNFFPVYLNIGNLVKALPPTDNIRYVLKQGDGAVNFVYTDLTPTNYMNFLQDTNEAEGLATSNAMLVTADGYVLDNNWVESIATNNEGIILVEGRTSTTNPLVLQVWEGSGIGSDPISWTPTNMIGQTKLYLSLSGVEQMFRHKNLMLNPVDTAPPDRLTDASVPNEPETIDKNFVFVHGYNVNTNQARGVEADVFKRMYWSGSQARFYGVTWEGADSQVLSEVTVNYQTNVVNAFNTAPSFAEFVASLTNGPVVVAAHSLGNMVVLDALDEYSAPISQYFMLDAAVPMEAIDPSTGTNIYMIDSAWQDYSNRLYAANWYGLWTNTDYRSLLAWNGRLTNFNGAQVYNFYSSGEEVLREYPTDPPTNLVDIAVDQLVSLVEGDTGEYTWAWQEKLKGLMSVSGILSSTHGGWKFNTNYDGLTVAQADALPDSELQTNAFFDFTSPTFSSDSYLEEPLLGDAYAEENRNRILSDAIPALSLPVGANPVPRLEPPENLTQNNFDMQSQLENGWPAGRPRLQFGNPAAGEWHHSDFHQVAYTFTYPLFNEIATLGNLK